jgi:hypothetical protein
MTSASRGPRAADEAMDASARSRSWAMVDCPRATRGEVRRRGCKVEAAAVRPRGWGSSALRVIGPSLGLTCWVDEEVGSGIRKGPQAFPLEQERFPLRAPLKPTRPASIVSRGPWWLASVRERPSVHAIARITAAPLRMKGRLQGSPIARERWRDGARRLQGTDCRKYPCGTDCEGFAD